MNIDSLHVAQHEEGIDYRQLHPTKEGARIWRFITKRLVNFYIKGIVPLGDVIHFKDREGRKWLSIYHNKVVVSEGYAWNGCTPKKWYPLVGWVGTPDFEDTVYASLVHDAFYQFHHTEHFPLHRSDCDLIFRRIIEQAGSYKIAETYHTAVEKFGKWTGLGKGEYSNYLKNL